jgi:hypothetical protein
VPAVVIEIADAVAAELNAAELSMPFVAERRYVPRFKLRRNQPGEGAGLPDLDTLRVSVVPRELSAVTLTRRSHDFDYLIDVAVQKRLEDDEPATVDPYMQLTEEVLDLFRGGTLPGLDAKCVAVTNEPIYAPEHLNDSNVFTSLVTLTFRKARAETS